MTVLSSFRVGQLDSLRKLVQPKRRSAGESITIDRYERLERGYAEQAASATEEPVFDEEDAAAVHRAVDTLEVKHREVLVLCFLEDMTITEIASIIGCPEGTVKSRIHHAKRALKAALRGAN